MTIDSDIPDHEMTIEDMIDRASPPCDIVPWSSLLMALYNRTGERVWFSKGAIEGKPLILLAGPEKSHKSWVAMQLAAVTTFGGKWLEKFPAQRCGPIIYLDGEYGEDEFVRRMARIAKGVGLRPEPVCGAIRHLNSAGMVLSRKDRTLQKILKEIKIRPPALIVVDPFRNHIDGSENDADVVIEAFRALAALRDLGDCPVLILHHLNKSGAASGSRALATRADLIIEGSDAEVPVYLTRGRKVRSTLDPIAKPFSIEVSHENDEDDLKAITRIKLVFNEPDDDEVLEEKILKLIDQEPKTARSISEDLKMSHHTIGRKLDEMAQRGIVRQKVEKVAGRDRVVWIRRV